MFKSLAVILSFTILFQSVSMQLGDFDKISNLFNHLSQYFEKGDSLTDFIEMHYGCELNNHKNEHKEHQKLPFKHQNLESHIQLVFIPSTFTSRNLQVEISSKAIGFNYCEPLAHLFSNYIFQPPRQA